MALVQFKAPVDNLQGKFEDVVYKKAGNQPIASKYVIPANPQTAMQVLVRTAQRNAAVAYKALTGSQVALWEAAASNVVRTRPNGKPYTFTAFMLFTCVNVHRQLDGAAITTTPPADFDGPSMPIVSAVTFNNTASTLTFTITEPTTKTGFYRVRITAPTATSARKAEPQALRIATTDAGDSYIAVSGVTTTITLDLAAEYQALFNASTVLQFGWEIVPLSDDYAPAGATLFVNREAYVKT